MGDPLNLILSEGAISDYRTVRWSPEGVMDVGEMATSGCRLHCEKVKVLFLGSGLAEAAQFIVT